MNTYPEATGSGPVTADDEDDPARAVEDALDAGDVERAAALLEERIWQIVFVDFARASALFSRLPREITDRPQHAYGFLLTTPLSLLPSPGVQLRLDPARFPSPDDVPASSREAVLVAQMIGARMRGDHAEAQRSAALVRAGLSDRPMGRQAERRAIAGILSQMGATEFLAGDAAQALSDFSTAATLDVGPAARGITSDALVRSAIIYAASGRLSHADRLLAQAAELEPLPTGDLRERTRGRLYLVRALSAVESMDIVADLALLRADEYGNEELRGVRLLARARWDVARGHAGSALDRVELFAEQTPIAPGSQADIIVRAVRADALSMLGLPTGEDAVSRHPLIELARVRELLLRGEAANALAAGRALVASPVKSPSVRAEALLLIAWATERLTGSVDARAAESAGALLQENGIRRPLALVPDAVRAVAGVPAAWLAEVPSVAPDPAGSAALSPREREVVRLLAGPGTVAEIAAELGVSVNTVKSQMRSIYRRLGVSTRAGAVARTIAR